jgi:hypothetical protein
MQHMQDKELDDLFRNKFEEAEMAPSGDLWAGIAQELDVKPKRRALPVYWMAAAVGVAALTIGLLFRNTHEKPVSSAQVVIAKAVEQKLETAGSKVVVAEPGQVAVTNNSTVKVKQADPLLSETHAAATRAIDTDRQGKLAVVAMPGANAKKDLIGMQPSGLNTHPDNTSIAVVQEKVNLPKAAETRAEEIVLASNNESPAVRDEVSNENEEASGKGIRNMGDLVNYVVDKLDKREEKVLQFKTEDDNSSLVALNIGVFKFNQKKHK